jgi:hypothetical protein
MSDELKMPVLGFSGGILQIVQPLPPSPNERYRRDIGNEHGLDQIFVKEQIADR